MMMLAVASADGDGGCMHDPLLGGLDGDGQGLWLWVVGAYLYAACFGRARVHACSGVLARACVRALTNRPVVDQRLTAGKALLLRVHVASTLEPCPPDCLQHVEAVLATMWS